MAIITLNNNSLSSVTALPAGVGGKVLQVVSTTKTDTFTTTSSSLVDITGMSVSITPSSTSSKIYVSGHVSYGKANGNSGYTLKLLRDSTEIGSGASAGSRQTGISDLSFTSSSIYHTQTRNFNYLDSPSTTSSTTYKLQTKSRDSSQLVINRPNQDDDQVHGSRLSSTITVMEIAG